MILIMRRLTIQPFFAWYDFWVGWYYDRKGDILYICPVPCFGLRIYIAGEGYSDRRKVIEPEREDME